MDKQETIREPIETKTTTVKLAEPLKLKRCVFAKGSKTEITWNLDPNNPIHLDALLLSVERSSVKQAVIAFEKFIEEELHDTILRETPEVHPEPTLDSKSERIK